MHKKILSFFVLNSFLGTSLFAQASETPLPPPDQSFMQTMIMIGIGIIFFYFILWKPEQKKRLALEQQRGALKQGDKVAAMGIIGTVVRIGDETVILKMYDGTKLEFYKAAVTDILPDSDDKKEDATTQK